MKHNFVYIPFFLRQ